MHLHGDVDEGKIRATAEDFQGEIWQMPPSRSAIKRELRPRTIDFINVEVINARDVQFRVVCEAGTYIRTLAVDIGQALGCGAHLTALRRTRSGSFTEEGGLVTMETLEEATQSWQNGSNPTMLAELIRPIEDAFSAFRRIIVVDAAVHAICQGRSVQARDIAQLDSNLQRKEEVGIFTLKGEIIARGVALAAAPDILLARKGFIARPRKIYMGLGVYPAIR
jgi:H/ACA ribonucleoprotein complex subunit 4